MACTRRVLGFALALAPALFAEERSALAEDKIDYADGPTACHAFHAKNDRELADWSKAQPAVPYAYPMENNVLGAPWGPFLSGTSESADLLVATLVPSVGAQLRTNAPVAVISFPWQIPIGPAYTCSRHRGTFVVRDYKFHRAIVEPGITAGQKGIGVFTRLGYRFLYHPSDWVVGAGGGIGTTIDLAGNKEPQRASLGPEAVMQFGHCCDASYFIFAVRYDRYFAGGDLNIIGGTLGYTFF